MFKLYKINYLVQFKYFVSKIHPINTLWIIKRHLSKVIIDILNTSIA